MKVKVFIISSGFPIPPKSPKQAADRRLSMERTRRSSLAKAKSVLHRLNSQPTTAKEYDMVVRDGESHESARLESLAIIRQLKALGREDIGSVITFEELDLIEATIQISVKLSNSHILAMQTTAEKTLDSLKKSDKGYLLDDEMYNSLKSFMTVTVETPKEKFQRAVKAISLIARSVSPLFGAAGSELPNYCLEGVTRWGFDVIDVEKRTNGQSLVWVCETLMAKSGLLEHLEIDESTLHCWLLGVNEGDERAKRASLDEDESKAIN